MHTTPRTLTRFLRAVFRFALSGQNLLTEEQILERYDVCKKCKQFTGKYCRVCDCFCTRGKTLMNKLAMPTEACPEGKWNEVLKS